ncbi:UNVERIFIED_CONTAM: hypothetical protein HDU68_012845, partial [Siphonaria sp. JEL0065]
MILPNTTIVIKRFNDFDPSLSNWTLSSSAGYASQVALDIQANHQDVVAVFGD